MDQRLEVLKAKHSELDQQIVELERQPGSNDIAIHQLKKQKLRLKDELLRLQTAN
jgi:uncharacterized protein